MKPAGGDVKGKQKQKEIMYIWVSLITQTNIFRDLMKLFFKLANSVTYLLFDRLRKLRQKIDWFVIYKFHKMAQNSNMLYTSITFTKTTVP